MALNQQQIAGAEICLAEVHFAKESDELDSSCSKKKMGLDTSLDPYD
jgi:hypothetical protein